MILIDTNFQDDLCQLETLKPDILNNYVFIWKITF